jgi:hypothetical protein
MLSFMSRIASSSEATFITPTTGPNDCISSEGAERDTPGKRIASMIQAAAGKLTLPRVGWGFILTKRVRVVGLIGAAARSVESPVAAR